MDLKVEINNCRCHPETCCCDDYYVQMPYDDRIPFFSRERAERFVAWVKALTCPECGLTNQHKMSCSARYVSCDRRYATE